MIRASIAMMGLAGLCAQAAARDLPGPAMPRELTGRFGYLGEWDVTATLASAKPGGTGPTEWSGTLKMKHNAICGPGETPEKVGHIRISVRGHRYSARMELAGSACAFSGTLSESAHSFVSCGGERQIPLRLWFK